MIGANEDPAMIAADACNEETSIEEFIEEISIKEDIINHVKFSTDNADTAMAEEAESSRFRDEDSPPVTYDGSPGENHFDEMLSRSMTAGGNAPDARFQKVVLEHLDNLRAQLVEQNDQSVRDVRNRRRRSSLKRRSILRETHEGVGGFKHSVRSYPTDCYTLIALNGPERGGWSARRFIIFCFGMIVCAFQVALFFLLVFSEMNATQGTAGDNDNPGKGIFPVFIPANACPIVRSTQIVSLLVYVIFPGSSVQDFVKVVQLFPRSFNEPDYPVWMMGFACCIRLCQSLFGITAVWTLVMSSETVIEIILNFPAINFISELDELAFSLAEAGVFGHSIKVEIARRALNLDLPPRYHARTRHYWIVMGFVFAVLSSWTIAIICVQTDIETWTTPIARVQFREEEFQQYSGCFKMSGVSYDQRRTYISYEQAGGINSTIGYCRNTRQWTLYEDPHHNTTPCDGDKDGLAFSPSTDTYDITSSFRELTSWVDSRNAPIDFFVFDFALEAEDLHCDLSLGDGVCDSAFNMPGYAYDEGDCCASTCSQPSCGRHREKSGYIFGSTVYPEVAFPNCIDDDTVPITIRLNNITSSRDPRFDLDGVVPWKESKSKAGWRSATPRLPYFALFCNEKNVFTAYIDETMEGGSETVMVEDGAICKLTVRNSGIDADDFDDEDLDRIGARIAEADPIWIVDYSIHQRPYDDDAVAEPIEVLRHESSQNEVQTFRKIPECYFQKLNDYVDAAFMYSGSEPSNQAINWLLREDENGSKCNEEFFEERFALATLISVGGDDVLIENENQCTWPTVTCSGGKVTQIDVSSKNLTGRIPTEMMMLTALQKLMFDHNELTGTIPSEVGLLADLQVIDFAYNKLTGSIPSEIGLLTRLEKLGLGYNQLTGSLPGGVSFLITASDFLSTQGQVSIIPPSSPPSLDPASSILA
mmetsp:Transcript_86/g.200  ORF Transcript_86/g.200 Transcript_86/m.200 type:complete len:932 (-) Transcript_86:518-3313(-)